MKFDSPEIIDNRNTEDYSDDGAWVLSADAAAYKRFRLDPQDHRYLDVNEPYGGSGGDAAWLFYDDTLNAQTDVEVYVTWVPVLAPAYNTYEILDGQNSLATIGVDQTSGPLDPLHDHYWMKLIDQAPEPDAESFYIGAGPVEVGLEVFAGNNGSADAAMVIPLWAKIDLATDSDNDGDIDADDDRVEMGSPGKIVAIGGDLHEAAVNLVLAAEDLDLLDGHTLTLDFLDDDSRLRVYKDPDRVTELDPNRGPGFNDSSSWIIGDPQYPYPQTVYVEGLASGSYTLTLSVPGFPATRPLPDTVRVTVPDVDLQIWNGQSGGSGYSVDGSDPSPPGKNGDEWNVGAFTLVNSNDSDGDGREDTEDSEVRPYIGLLAPGEGKPGDQELVVLLSGRFQAGDEVAVRKGKNHEAKKITAIDQPTNTVTLDSPLIGDFEGGEIKHRGRREIDLMKLLIARPEPLVGGSITLSVNTDNVKLWEESYKDTPVALTNRELTLPANQIPPEGKELWVEVVGKSQQVRDIVFELEYQGVSDFVRATGVWAEFTASMHDNGDQPWEDVNIDNPPIPITPLGLRPRTEGGDFLNGILMQFTVGPAGITSESSVKFDVTRQINRESWKKDGPGDWDRDKDGESWPLLREFANDDAEEEDDTDESPVPMEANHMYSLDAPGPAPQSGDNALWRMNAREWVRVRFDGQVPENYGISGSRASDVFDWHARHNLIFDGQEWKRTTGDDQETDENDVDQGHIDVYAELP